MVNTIAVCFYFDTTVLLPKNDNSDLKIVQDELLLLPDDEIIVMKLTKMNK